MEAVTGRSGAALKPTQRSSPSSANMQASTTTDQTDISDRVWSFFICNSSFSKHPRHPRYPWFLDLTVQRFNAVKARGAHGALRALAAAKPFVFISGY